MQSSTAGNTINKHPLRGRILHYSVPAVKEITGHSQYEREGWSTAELNLAYGTEQERCSLGVKI